MFSLFGLPFTLAVGVLARKIHGGLVGVAQAADPA